MCPCKKIKIKKKKDLLLVLLLCVYVLDLYKWYYAKILLFLTIFY